MFKLKNKLSKADAIKKVQEESFPRTSISFYRYVDIKNPLELRDELFLEWTDLQVLGRIYLSEEGINAQLSIPSHRMDEFRKAIDARKEFKDVPFKIGLEETDISFWKLTIKVRKHILAHGLKKDEFDIQNVGKHLTPEEFNKALDDPETIVVDMRNSYESALGHFKGAVKPECETFREELPKVAEELKGKEEKKVLLYCTGGIRCEPASAYLKQKGFKDVNQLFGGVINYVQEVKKKGLKTKYIGKNFVFDGRRAETVTDDVLATCDICEEPADETVDCENLGCHVMFIQCKSCQNKLERCCSKKCQEITHLPEEEQKALRKGKKAEFLYTRK